MIYVCEYESLNFMCTCECIYLYAYVETVDVLKFEGSDSKQRYKSKSI